MKKLIIVVELLLVLIGMFLPFYLLVVLFG
jgi:hypothetical protein